MTNIKLHIREIKQIKKVVMNLNQIYYKTNYGGKK